MVHAETRIRPGEWDKIILYHSKMQTDHLNPARQQDLVIIHNNKKEKLP